MSISGNCVLLFIFLEKMPQCKNCFLFDEEKLENAFNQFEDRHSLVLFILNIQEIWLDICKCDGENVCLACQSNICYREYQYNIYEHCLNFDFLSKVKENLYHNLFKMVPTFIHFLCKIINRKYQYTFKYWFTSEDIKYDLNVCLANFEEHKIKSIINNTYKLKVVI